LAATGDASYDAYAETCAQYIIDNPLNIWTGNLWTQRLNFFVKGWCAGNLYLYGEEIGNAAYMAEAVTQGQDVLDWINVDPVLNLAVEYWAMSSGTAVWGLCNSLFRDDPLLGQTWLGLHAYEVQNWQDWYSVPGYDWDSSWNVAYANAKFAMSDVQGNPNQAFFGALTTNALLSYDTDDDGGIVAESMDPVTEDMSWVTCYLCKFGVDRMMGDPHGDDVGILSFVGYESGDAFGVRGDTIPIIVTPTNWGLSDAPGVTVHFEGGGAGSGSWVRDLSFAEIDTLVVNPAWIPDEAGIYVLTVWTEYPGDEESINDELELEFNISPSTDVPESASGRLRLLSNPFVGGTEFRLSLAAEESVRLEIFDVRGRRVDVIEAGTRGAGEHRLEWDGRGSAAGIYLYRFESTRGVETGRMVKLK